MSLNSVYRYGLQEKVRIDNIAQAALEAEAWNSGEKEKTKRGDHHYQYLIFTA